MIGAAKPYTGSDGSGAALLDDLRAFVARFVAAPLPEALDTIVLWAAHAHMAVNFYTSPRLALLSPEPGSGKTRVLEVLYPVVPRPMFSFSASPAAIFRKLAQEDQTLLFDEVDTIFTRKGKDDGNEDLRALLNAGYRRGATIPRCVGPRHEVQEFAVFAAVALAGLGDLPDTIMTRSVIIRMRRRAPTERIEQFRMRIHEPEGAKFRDRLAAWAADVGPACGEAWPDLPPGVVDRDAEIWEPLIAVADAAGGHWPETARAACVELLKIASDRDVSLGVRLLGDLRTAFDKRDSMSTNSILEALNVLEEAPWGDLHGKKLEARTLARMLKRYGVTSTKVKEDGRALQGYRLEDMWDTWQRYLAPVTAQAEPPEPSPGGGQSRVGDGASTVPHTDVHSIQVPLDPEPAPSPVPPVPEPPSQAEPRARVPDDIRPEVPEVPHLREPKRPLADRAVSLVAELRQLEAEAVRQRWRDSAAKIDGRLDIPTFVLLAGPTQPVQTTATLEMAATDLLAGVNIRPWPEYLTAARAAFDTQRRAAA